MVDFNKLREDNKRRREESQAASPAISTVPTTNQAEKLDHTPLVFGKFRGKTPSDISETKEGAEWLVWAYENVKNRPVCSELLARDCGWRHLLSQGQGLAVSRQADYDDMDDDIPF